MKKSEIKEKLIEALVNLLPNTGIDRDMFECVDLIDDLGMDSITFISVVVEIERTFEIIVPDEMLVEDSFRNIDKILAIIENQLLLNQRIEEVLDVKAWEHIKIYFKTQWLL